jgi:eukaryotic-like serine/threonine-protein kinase
VSVSRARDGELESELAFVSGRPIVSELHPDVSYRIERMIGKGGFGFACLAIRQGPDGCSPVVLKIIRPRVVAEAGDMALRVIKKEAVALGRLNERVPPTPFVVRLLDTGSLSVLDEGRPLEVPWIAIEYVHGGALGETLQRRVRYALEHTGFAFEPERASRVLDHLTRGIEEIHAAEVIHRDLKPSNVLCCGFGTDEIYKISDFGIARPTGLSSTFGDLTLGTPGYVAPEQVHLRDEIGPWTDVFSLAAVVYFVLTGQKYFQVPSSVEGVMAATSPERASLLDAPGLGPELRNQPDNCAAIDDVLRRATAPDPKQRIRSARQFAQNLAPWLDSVRSQPRSGDRLANSVMSTRPLGPRRSEQPLAWTVRHAPRDDFVIASLAWDADAHCLALTTRALVYWDGTRWTDAPTHGLSGVGFVARLGPGQFIVGTQAGELFAYARDGVRPLGPAKHRPSGIQLIDGELDDLAVAVSRPSAGPAELSAVSAGRWLRSMPLPDAAHVASLSRIDDDSWLVVGRAVSGGPYAALYSPLRWQLERIPVSDAPALVASSSQLGRRLAVAVGGRGLLLRVDGGNAELCLLPGAPDLSAVGVDVLGGVWAAGRDGIWYSAAPVSGFSRVWHDERWSSPFVALAADVGFTIAVSVDGGVVELRDPMPARSPSIAP